MAFFDFVKQIVAVAAPIVLGPALGGGIAGIIAGEEAQLATITDIAKTQAVLAAGGAVATGGLRKRTIVQTVDAMGKVVKQKVTKGGVAVFQADVTAANRVARQVRKLDKRMPRKLVKQSEIARLKDEVTEAALRSARDHADRHPKC